MDWNLLAGLLSEAALHLGLLVVLVWVLFKANPPLYVELALYIAAAGSLSLFFGALL